MQYHRSGLHKCPSFSSFSFSALKVFIRLSQCMAAATDVEGRKCGKWSRRESMAVKEEVVERNRKPEVRNEPQLMP